MKREVLPVYFVEIEEGYYSEIVGWNVYTVIDNGLYFIDYFEKKSAYIKFDEKVEKDRIINKIKELYPEFSFASVDVEDFELHVRKSQN